MNAVLDMVDEAKAMSGASGEAVRPYSTRSWAELSRMVLDPPAGLIEVEAECRNGKAERIRV